MGKVIFSNPYFGELMMDENLRVRNISREILLRNKTGIPAIGLQPRWKIRADAGRFPRK